MTVCIMDCSTHLELTGFDDWLAGECPQRVEYEDLPMSADALFAVLEPWRKHAWFFDYEDVPRQLLVDLGVIHE